MGSLQIGMGNFMFDLRNSAEEKSCLEELAMCCG